MAMLFLLSCVGLDMADRKQLSRTVLQIGDSQGVTLPRGALEEHGVSAGDELPISRYDSEAGEITFSLD